MPELKSTGYDYEAYYGEGLPSWILITCMTGQSKKVTKQRQHGLINIMRLAITMSYNRWLDCK